MFAMQSICCTVLSTSHVFLPFKIGFRNLGQWTYFFGVTCIHGTIAFSESSGLILGVAEIKYGREFIFLVL